MATVRIGDMDLRVLHKRERGSFKRDMDLIALRVDLEKAEGVAAQMKLAEMVHVYVRESDPPVTLEWLVENMHDVYEVLRDCAVASGRQVKDQDAGEAARP